MQQPELESESGDPVFSQGFLFSLTGIFFLMPGKVGKTKK
jgi:hypothetical protein